MKRTFAVVALLAALGVLFKLALKETPRSAGERPGPGRAGATVTRRRPTRRPTLLARYPRPADRELVERTLRRYRQTALAIERTDGLRGLALLDRLDLEAIYLYEKHPNDFRRLRRQPDRRRGGRAAPALARILRPEAGRRHRPGDPDRRDRPALAGAAPGGGPRTPTPCRCSWPTRPA